jgi:hypothetical protein
MMELLGTYTDDIAPHAGDDAMKCIVTILADLNTFLLEPLLPLKPVRFLEGELIAFLKDKLQIEESEVKPFIIETKLVRVRINQREHEIHISSTIHRTFRRAQWQ